MMSSAELHVTFGKALFLTLVVKAKALTELPQKPRLTLLGMRQTHKPTVLTRNTHTSTHVSVEHLQLSVFPGLARTSAAANRMPPHPIPFLTCVFSYLSLQVFKETKQKRVSVLELSGTFLPQCNRQKLLEYILSFVVL